MTEQVPAYSVVSTQDSMAYDAQRGMVRHKRVNVRYADGTQTYVEVPFTPDWATRAEREIQDHYQQHQDVMAIRGPGVPRPAVGPPGATRGSGAY